MHEIVAVREAWLDAVRRADADAIAPLVTEDVLVVHPNGRTCRASGEQRQVTSHVLNLLCRAPGGWQVARVISVLNQ